MAYESINWQNGSSGGTPLSAENLNHMESGIEDSFPLVGTYTEGSATVDAVSVSISLTFAEITAAVADGRDVYLRENGGTITLVYTGTKSVDGKSSHTFGAVAYSGSGGGTTYSIVYPQTGTAYLYSWGIASTAYVSEQIANATEFASGTFTITGTNIISCSLTYAQITGLVSNGKHVVLSGTYDGTTVQLLYYGTGGTNVGHVFGAVFNGMIIWAQIRNVGVNLINLLEIPDGAIYTQMSASGDTLTLFNGVGDTYDVYLTSAVKSTVTASDTNPVNSVAVTSYAQPLTDKVSVSGTSVTQALDADKMYVFGEVTALTVTLNAPSDSSHVHEYHFRFTSGATPTVLSLPASVVMNETLTVEANKTYELSIIDNYGVWCAW